MTFKKTILTRKLCDFSFKFGLGQYVFPVESYDYMLGIIFYKYLSEKVNMYANRILSNKEIKFANLDESNPKHKKIIEKIKSKSIQQLGYFVKPNELFESIAKRDCGTNIIPKLKDIFKNIEKSNIESNSKNNLDDLLSNIDLHSDMDLHFNSNQLLTMLKELKQIDFELKNNNFSTFSDAYEYLIKQFTIVRGRHLNTPQSVAEILSRIVSHGKKNLESVYDPTCGSGSLLLQVAKQTRVDKFYGQEMDRKMYNVARMNMIVHNDVYYSKFDIQLGNTLHYPAHTDKKFKAIVANILISDSWLASKTFKQDERFSEYGILAPKSKANIALIQHMLYHLDNNGIMGVVLPHGVLFRLSAEQTIRTYIIERLNALDAVIGLPVNMFYGMGMPICILVFKKHRENKDIMFIDASHEYIKGRRQNTLTQEQITKIINTYIDKKDINGYARFVPIAEIKENDYNLNIPRYIEPPKSE